MNDNIKTWPERIWLQHECDEVPNYEEVYRFLESVTWCEESIEENNIEYVRADFVEKENAKLRHDLAKKDEAIKAARQAIRDLLKYTQSRSEDYESKDNPLVKAVYILKQIDELGK